MINCIHLTQTIKPLYSERCHQMILKKAIHSQSLEFEWSKYCYVLLVVLNKSWDFSWILDSHTNFLLILS